MTDIRSSVRAALEAARAEIGAGLPDGDPWYLLDEHCAVFERYLSPIAEEMERLQEADEEHDQLIRLQRSRFGPAATMWQEAHGKPSNLYPDLGELIEWLLASNAGLVAEISLLRSSNAGMREKARRALALISTMEAGYAIQAMGSALRSIAGETA